MRVKIGNYPSRLRSKIFEDHMHRKYGYIDWPAESQYTRLERALEWPLRPTWRALARAFRGATECIERLPTRVWPMRCIEAGPAPWRSSA